MAAEPITEDKENLSMEEILQSIRKIISDEDQESAVEEETPEASGETDMAEEENADSGSDVLELTDMVEEVVEETPAEEPAEAAAPAEAVDILQEIDDALDDGAGEALAEEAPVEELIETPPAEEPVAAPLEEAPVSDADRLISEGTAAASASSLKKVVETHKAATPVPHMRNGVTVEDLVLESIKPMLKEWLDQNLPSMVERIVEREIRKLVD